MYKVSQENTQLSSIVELPIGMLLRLPSNPIFDQHIC